MEKLHGEELGNKQVSPCGSPSTPAKVGPDTQVEDGNEPPVGGESEHCDVLSHGSWALSQPDRGSLAKTSDCRT